MSLGARAVRAVYYAFVFWIPVETVYFLRNEGSEEGITLSRPLGMLLFGLALVEWRTCFRRLPAVFWLAAWYLGAFAVSQLRLPGELDSVFLRQRFVMIQNLALFLISVNLFANAAFRRTLLRSYGWWICLVAAGMMLGAFGGEIPDMEGRSTLLGQDPNVTAGLYAMGAICVAGYSGISSAGILKPLAVLAAICAAILAIFQTGSRGGLIVFVSGMLALVLCGSKATRGRRFSTAAAVIAMLAVMLVREFQQGSVTASRLTDAWSSGDTAGRTNIFRVAWAMFLEKPLLGYGGTGNLFTLGLQLNYGALRATHNMFLNLLTETGLVGAAPFLAALTLALRSAWRCGRRTGEGAPFAMMCALMVFNLSISGSDLRIFWIVLAAAVGCGLELEGAARPARAVEAVEGARHAVG